MQPLSPVGHTHAAKSPIVLLILSGRELEAEIETEIETERKATAAACFHPVFLLLCKDIFNYRPHSGSLAVLKDLISASHLGLFLKVKGESSELRT